MSTSARMRGQLAEICANHLPPERARRLEGLARPAIRLDHADGPTRSHLGGLPVLEDAAQWPRWRGRALSLVAVVDLSELVAYESDLALPSRGVLNVFYDYDEQPWGFDPADRGGWRVVLAAPDRARSVVGPAGAETFSSIGLAPRQIVSLPGWEEPMAESVHPPHLDRSDAAESARAAFHAVQDEWNVVIDAESAPHHQIGGWPQLQQGPIWRECDVVSRGLPLGTVEDWRAAEPTFSVEREADWRLLLQLDTDDDAGWMWGDVGSLYVAVRRSLPAPAVFDEAWLVLQCGWRPASGVRRPASEGGRIAPVRPRSSRIRVLDEE